MEPNESVDLKKYVKGLLEQIDHAMDNIMRPTLKRDIAGVPDLDELPHQQGVALGLATALAMITAPDSVDKQIDEIRDIAMARYLARQE